MHKDWKSLATAIQEEILRRSIFSKCLQLQLKDKLYATKPEYIINLLLRFYIVPACIHFSRLGRRSGVFQITFTFLYALYRHLHLGAEAVVFVALHRHLHL